MPSDNAIFTRITCWFLFEAVLPVMLALAVWPLAGCLFDVNNSYTLSLGGGDLLPVSALIMICTVIDFMFSVKLTNQTRKIICHVVGAGFSSAVLLLSYGFIKAKYLSSPSSFTSDAVPNLFYATSTLSIILSFFSIGISFYIKTNLLSIQHNN